VSATAPMALMAEAGGELSAPERQRLAELEAIIERDLAAFTRVGQALLEVRDRRLYRERYSSFERYVAERWGFGRAHAYRLMAAAEVAEKVSPVGDIPSERVARELAPLLREQGEEAVVDVYRELREKHGEAVTAEVVRRAVLARVERQERERASAERRQALAETGARVEQGETWRVETADFRSLELEPGSIGAIITDPPYALDFVPILGELAERAATWLRPGGLLVAMLGHRQAHEAYPLVAERLEYVWTLAYVTSAGHTGHRYFAQRIFGHWKPMLVFRRPGGNPDWAWGPDVIRSPGAEKELHGWQQSEDATAALVERFSREGEIVLDPFCGSGTTGVACLRLGRRFIGCEIDPETANIARGRLAEEERRLRENAA
jgi:16S rRNA G966 N2-methylase RsmD